MLFVAARMTNIKMPMTIVAMTVLTVTAATATMRITRIKVDMLMAAVPRR